LQMLRLQGLRSSGRPRQRAKSRARPRSNWLPCDAPSERPVVLYSLLLLEVSNYGNGSRGGNRAEFPRCFPEKVDLILADTSGKMDTWRNPVVSQLNSIL